MLRVAICDADGCMRDYLEKLVKDVIAKLDGGRYGQGNLVIQKYAQAEKLLQKARFDILLLDVGMEGMNGMEAVRRLRRESDAAVIFVTALQEYVFEAFDVGAFHYLLKPVDEGKFRQVFGRAVRERLKRKKKTLLVKTGGMCRNIALQDIYYVENRGRKVVLHTSEGEIEYYDKMKLLEEKLGDGFYRSHRGYLVNLAEISCYDSSGIVMKNGEEVFLAKQKYHDFVETYIKYLKIDEA